MIANITKGRGFLGTLNYLLDKPCSELIGGNMLGQTAGELAAEFGISQRLNPNIEKPVFHVSLSLPYRASYEERLDSDRWCAIAKRYLDEMGFTDNQYVLVRHQDRHHDHIHIVAARGSLEKSYVSDWQDYYRTEVILRKLEKDYDLEAVTPSWEVQRRDKSKGQIQQHRREVSKQVSGVEVTPSLRARIQDLADKVLKEVSNRDEYISRMQLNGVKVMTHARLDGAVYGISYQYNMDGVGSVATSGTKLGQGYTWNGIHKRLQNQQVTSLSDPIGFQQPLLSLDIRTSIPQLESDYERSTQHPGAQRSEPINVSDLRRRVVERLSATSREIDLPGGKSAAELRASALYLDKVSRRIEFGIRNQQPYQRTDERPNREFTGSEPRAGTETNRAAAPSFQPRTELQHLSRYFEGLNRGNEQLNQHNNRLKTANQPAERLPEPASRESAPGLDRHLGVFRETSQSFRKLASTVNERPGKSSETGLPQLRVQPDTRNTQTQYQPVTPSDRNSQIEPTFCAPARCEDNWSRVEHFLVEQVGFSSELVGELHEKGVVYSTFEPTAGIALVCLKTDLDGTPSGTTQSCIQTNLAEVPYDSVKNEGWFKFTQGQGPLQRIAITESALDALSLATLEQPRQKTLYLAIDGNSHPHSSLRQFALAGGTVQVALGLDQANEMKAKDLLKELPNSERLKPSNATDWRKQLQHYRQMWEHYAQKSGVADGAGKEFPVGKLAYEDGHSKFDVAQMLFQSSALRKMQLRVGVEEARRYAGKVTKTIFGELEAEQRQTRPKSKQIIL